MKLVASVLLFYGAVVLTSGVLVYRPAANVVSLLLAVVSSVLFLSLGIQSVRGSLAAGYAGGALTLLQAIYFAYRFLAAERFIPNGLLLIVSFIVLFVLMVGFFLALQQAQD